MMLRKRWPILFGIMLFCLILSYILYFRTGAAYSSRTTTASYGILGFILLVILTLYSIKKRTVSYKFGSTQAWLLAHIYIGIFTLFVIIIHAGINLSGTFSVILFFLFISVFVSGIVGVLIYRNIPLSLSKFGRDVFTLDQINNKIVEYKMDVEKSISGMTSETRNFYNKNLMKGFKSKRTRWEYMFIEEAGVINKQKNVFEKYISHVSEKEAYATKLLMSSVIEVEKLKFMMVKIKLLKAWLNFHVPLTGALFTASIIHILAVIYF